MLMDGPVKPHYTPGAGIVFLEPDDAMLRSVVTDTSKALIRDDFGDDFFVNVAAGQIVDSDSDSDWEVRMCFTCPSCAGITSIVDVAVGPKCLHGFGWRCRLFTGLRTMALKSRAGHPLPPAGSAPLASTSILSCLGER